DVLRPTAVLVDRIHAEPDDLDAALVELGLDLGHVAELRRADRGEVLRVREQHRPRVADPVVEVDVTFRRIGLEIRCRIADLQSHSCSPLLRASVTSKSKALGAILVARTRAVQRDDGRLGYAGDACPEIPTRTGLTARLCPRAEKSA